MLEFITIADYFRFKFFKQSISGIGIGNKKNIIAKQLLSKIFCISAAKDTVNKGRMEVNNKFIPDNIMKRCLYRGPAVLSRFENASEEVFLYLLFSGV